MPVNGIRFASRATKGVTIFNTAEGEKVVSVERISEPQADEEAEENGAGAGENGEGAVEVGSDADGGEAGPGVAE